MAATENQTDTTELELPLGTDAPEDITSPENTGDEQNPPQPEQKVDELAALQKRLDEAERRAEDAESRANSLATEKTAAEGRITTEVNTRFAAQEQAIDARAASAKDRLTNAKRELTRAQAEQRYEDVGELYAEISSATLDARQAEWEKTQITQFKERAKQEAETINSRSKDPVDEFLSSIPGEPSRKWLRDHPEILRKAAVNQRDQKALFGAAQLAEGRGHTPDSPEYFEFIEEQLGLKEPAAPVTTTTPAAKAAPKPAGNTSAAAPSGRSAAPSSTPRVVQLDDVVKKLTGLDRQNAKISFPDKTQDEAEKLYAQGIVISKQREPGFRPDIRL